MIEVISMVFVVLGASFALIGSIGLLRFPDVFTRLHGPTKATTLGVGGVLLGTVVYLLAQGEVGVIRELLVTVCQGGASSALSLRLRHPGRRARLTAGAQRVSQ
jgi:monovalent cation/proton antiporter MnhG/PhaG subunit